MNNTTTNSVIYTTGTDITGGTIYTTGTSVTNLDISTIGYPFQINSDFIEFFELVLLALGHDISYDNFSKMSENEKKSIIRDIKINRVLK